MMVYVVAIIVLVIGFAFINDMCEKRKERILKELEYDWETFDIQKERLKQHGIELQHCGGYVVIEDGSPGNFGCTDRLQVDAYYRGLLHGLSKKT
jgi:hypothetical protein